MKKMKAFPLIRYGNAHEAFEERELDVPTPTGTEVLIKVEGFGLNFADVMARRGLYQDTPPLPAVLGYDVVGTITALGEKVQHLKIGDRVVALTRFGGYAQYSIAQEFACAKITLETPVSVACALATQFCTAQYMIEKSMRILENDKVLVHSGAGGVGSALIQLAKRKKAYVITTVGSKNKSEIAKKIGADEVILYSEEDFKKEIELRHGLKPMMAVFDAIGGKNFRKSMSLLMPSGTLCAYGVAENTQSKGGPLLTGIKTLLGFGFLSPPLMMMNGNNLIGVNMLRVADHHPLLFKEILTEVIELFNQGQIKPLVDTVHNGQFPISQLAMAHELLETRKSIGKISVIF